VLIPSLIAFLLGVVWFSPIHLQKLKVNRGKTHNPDELNDLIKLRSAVQISDIKVFDISIPSWAAELKSMVTLNSLTGIAVLPVVDHIIGFERDQLELEREFQKRSATAKGASLTLMVMPVLMWLIAQAIGVNAIGFILSPIGFLVLTAGILLTLLSRLIIRWVSKSATTKPKHNFHKPISENIASMIAFVTIFVLQSTYLGFFCAISLGLLIHWYWQMLPIRDEDLEQYWMHDSQSLKLVFIAGLLETGLPWSRALEHIDDMQLQAVGRRIDMGVAPETAFGYSTNWQDVGSLIGASIRKGSKISNELRLLANEYRSQALAFRIQHCEKAAGRLIIPVNLLQLPAFILMGLVPMIGPLVMQTLDAFHI
jgi:hypothetical protein